MRFRLLTVLIFLFFQCLSTPNEKVMQITIDDGLINGNIHQITQDTHGFLWIATENGLVRYDGFEYKIYQTTENERSSISHNFVHSVAIADSLNIWIGTMSGVDHLNIKTGKFNHFHFYNTLGNTNMKPALQVIPIGSDCYVRTDDKSLYFCKIGNDTIKPLSIKQYKGTTFITAVESITNQTLAIGNKSGDFYIIKNGEIIHHQHFGTAITSIKKLSTNEICVCSENSVMILDKNNYSNIISEYQMPYPIQIQELKDSSLLIATRSNGIFQINSLGEKPYNLKNLINKNCTSIFQDSFDNIWIGHAFGGITVQLAQSVDYNDEKIAHILTNDKILAIAQTKNNIYIGTDGNGLFIYNKNSQNIRQINSHTNFCDKPFDDVITAIVAKDNLVWLSTYNKGIYCFSEATNSLLYYNELLASPVKNISSLYIDNQWNIWIGTYDSGVVVFNTQTRTFDRHFTGYEGDAYQTISCNGITCFFEDSNNTMWLGSYYGITKITSKNEITIYRYNDFPGMRSSVVTTIQQNKDGKIWFGSLQGLSYYDATQDSIIALHNVQIANSLAICNIIPQEDSTMIIVTPKLLYLYDYQKNTFHFISTIPKGEFVRNSFLQDEQTLLLGTDKGIKSISTLFNLGEEKTHNLQLTDIKVQGKSIFNYDSKYTIDQKDGEYYLKLPYYEKEISISFSDFYFDETRPHNFVYRLEGLNDRKILLQNGNTISYTNLQGGDYILYISHLGNPNDELAIHIHIAKAFWEQTIFYVISFLLIIGLITFFFIRRMQMNIRVRNKLLKQIDLRIKDSEEKNRQIELQNEQIRLQRDAATRQRAEVEQQRSGLEKRLAILIEKDQKNDELVTDLKQKSAILNKEKLALKQKLDLYEENVRNVIFKLILSTETIEYISPSVAQFTGYEDEEFYSNFQLIKKLLPKEILKNITQYWSLLLNGQIPEKTEFQIITKDKTIKQIQQLARYETDIKGRFTAIELQWIEISGADISSENTTIAQSIIIDEPKEELYDWSAKKILVADADEQSFEFITECLANTHISIIRAHNGEQAINLCCDKNQNFDIVLMDMQLPNPNGFETTLKIREQEVHIPIIAQTLYSNYDAKIQCFDAGCDTYISKPYKQSDLQRVISNYLEV